MPRTFAGVQQFVAVGPAIRGYTGGRSDGAIVTLQDFLRLVVVESRRPVALLRILGRAWPISAFGCDSPAGLEQRLGAPGAERLQSLCWLADLTGIGGSAAAAALIFQADDARVLHVFLDFLTDATTEANPRWKELSAWRDDRQLAASVEAAVLHPIASSPAALAAFWAALGTAPPGAAITLSDMAWTAALCGLEWDRELADGLSELSAHWLVAASAPEEVKLRRCGTLIGLGDLWESRLLSLAGRVEDLAAQRAESAPTAWEAYRYALNPVWPDYHAMYEHAPDANALVEARRELVAAAPEELLTHAADLPGSSDLVAIAGEVRVAFAAQFPGISLIVDAPPAAPVGIPDRAVYVLLYEMLGNAADALPGGGMVAVTIDITGGDVMMDVQDTGPGIATDVVNQGVFRKEVSTRGEDRGLGLWIARRLATLQADGDILLVAPRHGHPARPGAHFRLVLPLLPE